MAQGVVFLPSFHEAIQGLDDSDRLQMYDAIVRYGLYGEILDLDPIPKAMFALVKPNIDASQNRYRAAKANGSKGGRPSKNQTENQNRNQNEFQKQNQDKEKDIDFDKDFDSEIDVERDKECEGKGKPSNDPLSDAWEEARAKGDIATMAAINIRRQRGY